MFRRRRPKNDEAADQQASVDAADGEEGGWTPDAGAAGVGAEDFDGAEAADGATSVPTAAAPVDPAAGVPIPPTAGTPADRSEGPWDVSEVADPEADGRLDLGSMWLPGVPGMELRVEVDQEAGSIASVTAIL